MITRASILFVALLPGCGEEANPPGGSGGGNGNGGREQSNQPCQTDENCATGDPCRIGTCNAASATCLFTPFDGDEDGHAPQVCGGDDCDDTTGAMRPGLEERCDGRDNDCSGAVDDGIDCANDALNNPLNCGPQHRNCGPNDTGMICVNGQCVCEEGKTDCPHPEGGRRCLDTSNDETSCGQCGLACGERLIILMGTSATVCTEGKCACAGGLTLCLFNNDCDISSSTCEAGCIDTKTDVHGCGRCNNWCAEGQQCVNGECR